MRSGRLDRRITIQRATITQNSTGEEIATWGTLATVWAELRQGKPGNEAYASQQFLGKTPLTFRIRWSTTVQVLTVKDRISYAGRTYDILDVREIGRREGLEIDAFARSETAVAS
jgi:SPP1 family predicted phage head-tail adaptor